MRSIGKYGRRPPKRERSLAFHDIRTGVIPKHPPYVDYLSHLGGQWHMLGNDSAGDCVSVTWANERRLVTATLTTHVSYPSQQQVWQFYKTQNPGFDPRGTGQTNGPGSIYDNGMDIQTALEELHKNGGPDGVKVVAFATVDHTNIEEVKAAIATCGSVWTGTNVYVNNEQEFSNEDPWDFIPGSQLDGGHSIISGGYGKALHLSRSLTGDVKFITWADETSFTDRYWANAVEECWAVIWPEHLGTRSFTQGISKDKLSAAYHQVTGSNLVF